MSCDAEKVAQKQPHHCEPVGLVAHHRGIREYKKYKRDEKQTVCGIA